MSKLKPGDRVEVVESYSPIDNGKRGVLLRKAYYNPSAWVVRLDEGIEEGFVASRLKRIPSEHPPMTDQATWTIPTDIEIKELFLGGTANLPATVTRETVQVGDVVKWIEDLPGQYAGSCECIGFRPDKRPVMYHTETSDLFVWFTSRESMPLISRPTAQPSERMRWNDPRLKEKVASNWFIRDDRGKQWSLAMDARFWSDGIEEEIPSNLRIFRIVEASK